MAKKNNKKIKVLTLGDHPFHPSGVGTQCNYIFRALLDSGDFEIVSLGGAKVVKDSSIVKTEEYGDDWTIYPVEGYGTQESIRSFLWQEKPDILWFMTDPRFYGWLWAIEDEVRAQVPMVYYHVWDNKPYPDYNKLFYESTDVIVSISKLTNEVVRNVAPDVDLHHIPHAVDNKIFKPLPDEEIDNFVKQNLPESCHDRMLFFWNNRNARRKQSGTLIFWFKEFLDEVGHDKATLLMHTEPKDEHGQDLYRILEYLDLTDGQVVLSQQKVPPEVMARLYNSADATINIADAEGFGLATLESLSCGTPIVVNMTGGLQEQVTDGEEFFGVGIEPASKAIIGSQTTPWIYEDRLNKQDFLDAMLEFYHASDEEKERMAKGGLEHVNKNYNYTNYCKKWVSLMKKVHRKHGSWPNRQYQSWEMREIL